MLHREFMKVVFPLSVLLILTVMNDRCIVISLAGNEYKYNHKLKTAMS